MTSLNDLDKEKEDPYKKGFIDGLTSFAHWEDGVQMVGTSGVTLKDAIENVESLYNYTPPKEE